jgi:carbonic anhydrase
MIVFRVTYCSGRIVTMNVSKLSFVAALAFATGFISLHAASPTGKPDPSAKLLRDASLMLLREGNARFMTGKPQHPHQDPERRIDVAKGQEPFATILACSDSRDPVELIFDRGVGDLFVVRVAGNIAGLSELATVEYGVGHLNTPILVVMGHTKCGAVTAVANGAQLHGHLHALADKIKPAVEKTKEGKPEPDELVPRCIQANVWQTIEDIIKQSAAVRGKLAEGKLSIIGAIYDLEQGKVSWLGQHPAEDSLVALASQAQTDTALASKSDPHGHAPQAKAVSPETAKLTNGGHADADGDTHPADDAHGKPALKVHAREKAPADEHDNVQESPAPSTKPSPAQVKPRTPPAKTPPPAEPFDHSHEQDRAPAKKPAKHAEPGDHH